MNECLQQIWIWMSKIGFAKPNFNLGNDDKLAEADKLYIELAQKGLELERRSKLLEIQAMPRSTNG